MAEGTYRLLLLNLGLAAAYFATGRLGLELAGYAQSVTLVWPPAGIALAALALEGRRVWPGIALGAFAVNLATGIGAAVALGIATGNTLGALAGLALLERVGVRATLGHRRDVAGLIGAALCFPLVSACVGVASLTLGGVLAGAQAAAAWAWWLVGDALGILLVAPVLLTLLAPATQRRRSWLEALALAVVLLGSCAIAFLDVLPGGAGYPLPFVAVPALVWAAARFGPRGTALATLATAAIATAATLGSRGPFSGYPLQQGLLFLGLLVAVFGATAFLLAAEVTERESVYASLVGSMEALARGERELRHSEERFRLLAENASDIVGEYDAEGNVLYLSPSLMTILGHSIEKVTAQGARASLDALIHPDDLPGLVAELQRINASKGGARSLYRVRHASGDWRWLETYAQSFEAADGTLHVVSVNRDVTDRVRAEEEARRLQEQALEAQKLESLGVLAGGIAHDFNNLLAVILGNASHVLGQLPTDSPLRGPLRDLETSGLRAAELIRQMLAYAGVAPLSSRVVDLSELVAEMNVLVGASLSKRARTSFHLARDLPPIECDPSQIRQIVMNLLTNASEALGEEEGSIHVETRVGEPGAGGTDQVVLEVRDTGCGMDAHTRTRMFDPFFTTKFAGRGLGLAAALGIVRLHRGSIEVESEVGAGTVVRVQLPASGRQAAEAAAPAPRESWRPGGTILVVDDEPTLRSMVKRVLTGAGFEVLSAADGREALDLFRERPGEIRAVLLDLTMPGLSGADVLSALRALRRDVPVVVSSGYSEAAIASHFRAEKPDALLSKPFRSLELLERLREAIEKPR